MKILCQAYYTSFTRTNIMATFEKSGMWLVNPARWMSVPVNRSARDVGTVLTVPEIDAL